MNRQIWKKASSTLNILVLVAALCSILLSASAQPASAATRCYNGTSKGLFKDHKGWHHYVEFKVDISLPDSYWYVKSSPAGYPFNTSLWAGYYQVQHTGGGPAIYKEAGYQWKDNWMDPYPASWWTICHR